MAKRGRIEQQLRQLLRPPAGFEAGTPSVKVSAEVFMHPKMPKPEAPPAGRGRRKFKPEPMPVRVVSIADRAKLGRR